EAPEEFPGPGVVLARCVCPFHEEADNPAGLVVYSDGWECATRGCHTDRTFGRNPVGLVRRFAHRLSGRGMDWREALTHVKAHRDEVKEMVEAAKAKQSGRASYRKKYVSWSAEDLAACLEVPDPYYLSRGYRPDTLEHFGVGRCVRELPDGEDLRGWSIFPV